MQQRKEEAQPIRVALIGFGHVNRAFSRLVAERQSLIRRSFGVDLQLVSISRSRQSLLAPASASLEWGIAAALPQEQLVSVLDATIRSTKDLEDVLTERRPDVVVQATPSMFIDTARDQLLTALRQRAHAVTATKSALVRGLDGLLAAAQASGRQLRYSAATAAALPTVDLIDTALRGATISGIQGVLNGTSTFVLSRMEEADCSLGEAVREAQGLGIAEQDPQQDLNGVDTAAKLIIITNTILLRSGAAAVDIDTVELEGLSDGIATELATARRAGQVVRLLGTAEFGDDRPRLSVGPERLDPGHPLAAVRGKDKGIVFHTDTMGDITVIGGASSPRGAGAALLRDLLAIFERPPANARQSGVTRGPGSRDEVSSRRDEDRSEA